jgi:hypothetical protein
MEISTMDNCRVKVNCILLQEIIMSESSDSTKKKEEVHIIGQENSRMYMMGNLRGAKEMEEVLSGGRMEAGTKVILRMGFKVDSEFYTEKEETSNIRGYGITACSTEREYSTLTMVSDTRVTSNKTNFMATEYFIKTTR